MMYALTNESVETSEHNKVANHYILLDCDMFRPDGCYHGQLIPSATTDFQLLIMIT